jgi:hypothetical protein
VVSQHWFKIRCSCSVAPGIEFATPPIEGAVDSDGAPLRFRTVQNINDTTKEGHDFEYSGLCFYAAEEPRSVDEALSEPCWTYAMQIELSSIQSNITWELSALPTGQWSLCNRPEMGVQSEERPTRKHNQA